MKIKRHRVQQPMIMLIQWWKYFLRVRFSKLGMIQGDSLWKILKILQDPVNTGVFLNLSKTIQKRKDFHVEKRRKTSLLPKYREFQALDNMIQILQIRIQLQNTQPATSQDKHLSIQRLKIKKIYHLQENMIWTSYQPNIVLLHLSISQNQKGKVYVR